VVDDEQIVLNLVEDTLTDEGYEVTVTPHPHEAIELARNKSFDFILTDIRMPEMSGIELVKEIHQLAPTTGVIFMTGYANLDTAKQAIKEISRAVEQKQNATKATLSQELNKITDLSKLMYASGDLASLLRLSLSFAIIQSNAKIGIAAYYDRPNQELALMEVGNNSTDAEDLVRLKMDAAEWDVIPMVGFPTGINEESKHPLYGTTVFQTDKMDILPDNFQQSSAAVIVPLIRSEKVLGYISLFYDSSDHELNKSDAQFFNFVSSQLSISLENLQLLKDSREAYRRLEYLQDQTIQMEKMATRGQMSAEIGHELNNYLGVVVANFQLMNLRIQKGVVEGLERFTESINDHLDKISHFTKGLMDYSSLQKMNFEPTDLKQMLSRVVEFMQPQKRFRELSIDLEADIDKLEAEVDKGSLEQVLYNLLNNAADASTGSDIKKINLKADLIAENMIRLSIKDQGAGISEDDLSRLFKEKFTTKKTGHGIGLVVCKNIIDKHLGKITVNSSPGDGTEFIIDLPVRHLAAKSTPEEIIN
jgi:signal transduction histidine kinase/DNA-binding NarL/FixJ family response regulator